MATTNNYGNGSITQRSPGSYQLRWRVDGKYETKTLKCTEPQAKRELRNILSSIDRGEYCAQTKLTIADGMDKYLMHVKSHVKAKTYNEYNNKSKLYIVPNFGELKLDKCKTTDFQEWFDKALVSGGKSGEGLSAQTLKHVRTLLKAMFNWYVDNEIIIKNPATKIKIPKPKQYRAEVLDIKEIQKLIETIHGSKYEVAIYLGIYTGCRRGEILGLTWDCVDIENRTIKIEKTLSQVKNDLTLTPPKTEDSYRLVYVDEGLINLLKQHMEHQKIQKLRVGNLWNKTNAVCTDELGGWLKPDRYSRMFKDIREKAGITRRFRLHDLRHTHTTLLAPYMDQKTLMDRMGWSNPNIMLGVYTHSSPEQGVEAARIFSSLITAPTTNK